MRLIVCLPPIAMVVDSRIVMIVASWIALIVEKRGLRPVSQKSGQAVRRRVDVWSHGRFLRETSCYRKTLAHRGRPKPA
jgi:hypothetical protein